MAHMPPSPDELPHSGIDAGEKPVREQLKKASIANQKDDAEGVVGEVGQNREDVKDTEGNGTEDKPAVAGQLDQGDDAAKPARQHTRKRSRDSTIEGIDTSESRKVSSESVRDSTDAIELPGQTNGAVGSETQPRGSSPEPSDDLPEGIASPKTKRSRLLSSSAEESTLTANSTESAPHATNLTGDNVADASAKATKSPSPNEKEKSPPPSTSASAFAASGFSALANSSLSGFGTVGKSTGGFGAGGTFATGFGSSNTNESAPQKLAEPQSSFGGLLGSTSSFASAANAGTGFGSSTSGFASLGKGTSVFGTSGSAFGGFAGSGGLTSFASGKPSAIGAGPKLSKPFGTPAGDEEEEEKDDNDNDNDEGGVKSPLPYENEKQDERFYEQDIATGEENEDTRHTCRAKLYNFASIGGDKKEWKERGLGTLRLNVTRQMADSEVKVKARLVMRADGSHRVVLNTPVGKDIKFGSPNGGPPSGSFLFFMGTIGGGLEPLQLKMKAQFALELYDKIIELQKEM